MEIKKDQPPQWRCEKCGYGEWIHPGDEERAKRREAEHAKQHIADAPVHHPAINFDFRQTVTVEVDGPEALVRRLVESIMVSAAGQINDHGSVRCRLRAQCDWLDGDGKVIPLDQVVAAAKASTVWACKRCGRCSTGETCPQCGGTMAQLPADATPDEQVDAKLSRIRAALVHGGVPITGGTEVEQQIAEIIGLDLQAPYGAS